MKKSRDVLVAWLHDPPDKPLEIRGHEARAARYLAAALSDTVTPAEIRGHQGDQRASATERLPVPDWRAANQQTVVGADEMVVCHPLSAARQDELGLSLPRHVDESLVLGEVEKLVAGVDSIAARFWLLWRFLPEYLERRQPGFGMLPADTRIPDHSIWQHLDTTAAMHVAYDESAPPSFISFSVGPVQSFISNARSVRDLWSGSMILSWLSFRAMVPILDQYGPAAVVYPSLRGNPLLDLWLRDTGELQDRIPLPSKQARKIPCLPNRFIALVPGNDADPLALRVKTAAGMAWQMLADAVHDRLAETFAPLDPHWDRHWSRPIEDQFDFRIITLSWAEATDAELARCLSGQSSFEAAFPESNDVRQLAGAIPVGDRPPGHSRVVGQWQHRVELIGRIAEADKMVRRVPRGADTDDAALVPPMCSMTGSSERIGPAVLADAAHFWETAAERVSFGGVRLRRNERLGPIALVKRFAGPVFFAEELGFRDVRELRFDDTATVAATHWIANANDRDGEFAAIYEKARESGEWSGQWLHQVDEDTDEQACPDELAERIRYLRQLEDLGPPPSYYAVLMMDGDELGKWLQGRKSPRVRDLMHPQLEQYFQKTAGNPRGLDAKRPVTPAFHASLSQALSNFALHFVPRIVERHGGTLIYAGGDDVLALLPTSTSLDCAAELQATYRKEWATDATGLSRMLMGRRATISAGLAVVHYKSDLRQAIQCARTAERRAKEHGRNALVITAARRSGEETSCLCPWTFLPTVQDWTRAFHDGASDRWAYQLRAMLRTLQGLPAAAVEAAIRRQVARSDPEKQTLMVPDGVAADVIPAQFRAYREQTASRIEPSHQIRDFVVLCQTASFLSRGIDR